MALLALYLRYFYALLGGGIQKQNSGAIGDNAGLGGYACVGKVLGRVDFFGFGFGVDFSVLGLCELVG